MEYIKFLILPLAVSLVIISSCTRKSTTPEDPIAKFQASLTTEDTMTVLNMCQDAMLMLKNEQYDTLFTKIYKFDNETKSVHPLDEETKVRYMRRFKLFPVKSFKQEYYGFLHETCNNVKYSVVFATAEQTGGEPARTSFMFLPVKIEGQWLLCLNTTNLLIDKDIHNH